MVLNFLLELASKDGDLTVIPRSGNGRSTVCFGRFDIGESLESVEVEVLLERLEFSSARFENLLSYIAPNDGVHWTEISRGLVGKLSDDLLVEFRLEFGLGGNLFGELDDESGIGGRSGGRRSGVSGAEGGESLETDVESGGSIPLGKIGDEVFRREEGFSKRFLGGELVSVQESSGSIEGKNEGETLTKSINLGILTWWNHPPFLYDPRPRVSPMENV